MQKPRPYDGPVDFIQKSDTVAAGWPESLLVAVVERMPYPPGRGVRIHDWITLVAHVSSTKREDVLVCADRLALYVAVYAELHPLRAPPSPSKIRRSQKP